MTNKGLSGTPAPPPIVCFGSLMVGLGLDYLWPLPLLPQTIQYAAGLPIIALSLLLFALVLREFSRSKTSIDHRKPTTEIISTGPFAYSRDPVYVSMTMFLYQGSVIKTHRDRVRFSPGRKEAAGDAGHRQGFLTPAGGMRTRQGCGLGWRLPVALGRRCPRLAIPPHRRDGRA